MGLANALPVPDAISGLISDFVFRSCSNVGECGSETDVANMSDVSDETVGVLTSGTFDPYWIQFCQKCNQPQLKRQNP